MAISCCLIMSVVAIVPSINTSVRPKCKYTIVIDAGHGGRDGGSVGVNGSLEKDLNLSYAKSLQKILVKSGVNVVMTRTNDNGLYNEDANNKKLSDMRKRREIINNTTPDLVISIHMNSFPLDSCKGAKTFYQIGSNVSFDAAKNIQNSLNYYIENASKTVSEGDYYILNCTKYTSVLIECGFLSSPEEEQLLINDNYREEFIYSVYRGIMLYLGI
ncbi:MAG: N-acetylmuramoyl-L-alanine amidase [Clostridia bacterium]|nr:N-acetylmuramoyl-L-alanine amidase [Clostridia bacterium]